MLVHFFNTIKAYVLTFRVVPNQFMFTFVYVFIVFFFLNLIIFFI